MRKRRVILFEDESIVLNLFRDFFLSMKYEVLAFSEPHICPLYAQNAPACTQRHPCADLVLTDFRMPRMNGIDLLQAQAERGCRLTTRNKALISGCLDPADVSAARAMGAACFQKPVDLDELESWVHECEARMDLTIPLGDRRREPRSGLTNVSCQVAFASGLLTCRAHDVSPNGFRLALPIALMPEQQVKIIADHAAVPRSAVVRWSARQPDGSYLTGLVCR